MARVTLEADSTGGHHAQQSASEPNRRSNGGGTRLAKVSQPAKDMTMSTGDTAGNNLEWDVLAIKRPGLSRDLPPGKEELTWAATRVTRLRRDFIHRQVERRSS